LLKANHLKSKKKPAGKKTAAVTADVLHLPEPINSQPDENAAGHSALESSSTSDPTDML
jgi:hypothetical protein